jgi:D-3-phosphoglycerate dehydrogenase / 2-oxoglutarate reductase
VARVAVVFWLARELPGWEEAIATLRQAGHDVADSGERPLTEAEFAAHVAGAAGLMVAAHPVPASVIDAGHDLRVIATPGIGVDKIDVVAATRRGILVCNTPGSNRDAVADHTVGMWLALARNLVNLDRATHAGHGWDQWPFMGHQLGGTTVLVIGTGNIGRAVIRRAVHGFGCQALAYDMRIDPGVEQEGVTYGDLDELLPRADFVSVHVPLTDSTRGLIDRRRIGLLKRGAVLVSISRGGIVDNVALADALSDGHLGGAGVDVFDDEPCRESPLFGLRNALLTPHVAGFSPESARESRVGTAQNIVAALSGQPRNFVNPEVLNMARER